MTSSASSQGNCPSDDDFAAVLSGQLGADERARLHDHVSQCSACYAVLREMARSVDPEMPTEGSSLSRYRLVSFVAQGGMGVVYRAQDVELGRTVAVKLLRPELSQPVPDTAAPPQSIAQARFLREALITSRLQHPSIVPVYQAGRWPTGEAFYAMKLISGRSLRDLVDGAQRADERLALLPHVLAAADAVGYAHSEGILHRDLKPANIMVGPFGETLVIDWGLAKILGGEDDQRWKSDAALVEPAPASLTVVGDVVGTPAYMAPEQARGEPVHTPADVYALGGILYHLLSGKPPVHTAVGAGMAPIPLRQHRPDAPVDLLAIVDKAMRADPSQRYPSAKELAEDLRRFQTGQLVAAHPYSIGTLCWRWIKRHRLVVTVATALLTILAVSSTLSFRRIVRDRVAALASRDAILMQQAITQLDRDPAAALAWLKAYPTDGAEHSRIPDLANEAISREAALHIFRTDVAAPAVDLAPVGNRIAVLGMKHVIEVRDLQTGRITARLPVSEIYGNLRFSPDGQRLAITGEFPNPAPVQLWDLASGSLQRLSAPGENATEVAWSPDGAWLASSDMAGRMHLWNLREGSSRRLRRLGHHHRFSPDSRYLFAFSFDETAVWRLDVATGEEQMWVRAPGVVELDMSRQGEYFAVRDGDHVQVWDLRTRRSRTVRLGDRAMKILAISEHGGFLDLASPTGKIERLNLDDRSTTLLGDSDERITGFALSPDESMVATGGGRGIIRVWDLRTGISLELRAATNGLMHQLRFSPDGTYLASAAYDGSERVWRLPARTRRAFHPHRMPVEHVVFAPDGKSLATTSQDQTIRIHDLGGNLLQTLQFPERKAFRLAYSPDGKQLVSGGYDGSVRLWTPGSSESRLLARHDAVVWPVAFSLDGSTVFSGSFDGVIRATEVATGRSRTLAGHRGRVQNLRLSPDGTRLASSGEDGTARLWDWKEGVGRVALESLVPPYAISFSRDGRWLAGATSDGSVDLFAPESGAHRRLRGGDKVSSLRFSPSADLVALVAGRAIELRTVDGRLLHRLSSQGRDIMRWDFSPDGSLIAASSSDPVTSVWEVASGHLRAAFPTGTYASALAFSNDGRTLAATTLYGGGVWIWPLDTLPSLPAEEGKVRAWLDGLTTVSIDRENRPTTP